MQPIMSMHKYLSTVLSDFNTYLEEAKEKGIKLCDPACDLTALTFAQGGIPDYSNVNFQRCYLLRYAYGYMYEYKKMYLDLFEKFTPGDRINVTSIGCGAGLDYWALVRALVKNGFPSLVEYRGIDIIDWHGCAVCARGDEAETVKYDFGNDAIEEMAALAASGELRSDIYFFPKSIGEFYDDQISALGAAIGNSSVDSGKKIYIMVSMRIEDHHYMNDARNITILRAALESSGFSFDESDGFEPVRHEGESIFLGKLDHDFRYPEAYHNVDNAINGIGELFRKLPMQCKFYEECKSPGDSPAKCVDALTRSPIFTDSQVCYCILPFIAK